MGGFLTELSKKFAERWLSLLVIPGVLYVAMLVAAQLLGHRHPVDVDRIVRRLDAAPTPLSTSALALILIATLLAAAAAGLAAQALGSLTERLWLADRWQSWPWPLRHLAESRTRSRQQDWQAATTVYQRQLEDRTTQLAHRRADPSGDSEKDLDEVRRAVTRIAQEEPARPTWIGDRVHAVISRLDRDYRLDLVTVWPNLWLTMPENTRAEITAARESLAQAGTLTGWGLLYLVAGALWWPGLLIAVMIMVAAWRQARIAADAYALLIEAAGRLYTADLAKSLGIDHSGPLTQRTGWALTCLLQGRSHLIPLTTDRPTSGT